jgi:hypothetical protein
MQYFRRISEGNRSLETRRGKWDDNVEMDLKERGYENVVLIHLFRITTRAESCEHGTEIHGSVKVRVSRSVSQ